MITAPQNTEAGRLLRMLNRTEWRALYRSERIVTRETTKAVMDAAIFGTGFIKWGSLGAPRRDGSDVALHITPRGILGGSLG